VERVWGGGFVKEVGSLKAEHSSQTRVSGLCWLPTYFLIRPGFINRQLIWV
jgi:hypothetical protein